jgi:hypothetical protein
MRAIAFPTIYAMASMNVYGVDPRHSARPDASDAGNRLQAVTTDPRLLEADAVLPVNSWVADLEAGIPLGS